MFDVYYISCIFKGALVLFFKFLMSINV